MPTKHRIFLAILILGAYSQIVQAMLIREGLVVFYGNEVSLGAFYGSWLFWLAVGSAAVVRFRERTWVREAIPGLRRLLLVLPPLLLLQVLALRTVRTLLDVSSSEFVPLGDLFLSLFAFTLPSGLAIGISFPLACKALRDQGAQDTAVVGLVSRVYVADALGALAGGLLFTFVLIQWLGFTQTLGVLTLALGVTAWSLDAAPGAGTRSRAWVPLLLGAAGLVMALPPASQRLESALERLRFHSLQPGMELLDSLETRYGHVAVARLGEQISIVGDGQIRESFPQPRETRLEAAYFSAQAAGARRVLVFGGFAGGLPAALLDYPVERVTVVEEDRRAFDRIRPFLPEESRMALADPRLELVFQDGRGFVNRLPPDARYDLVLALSASPSSAYSNRYFTQEFYRQVHDHLSREGVFCTQVSGASNYLGTEVGSYAGSIYQTLKAVIPHLAIAPGDPQVLCASPAEGRLSEDPEELERRYLATDLAQHELPSGTFSNLLPAEQIAYVRDRLEQTRADINTDERPVTYYLNMVLWGKFSASALVEWLQRLRGLGTWPYLLPPALFVVLWLLRSSLEGFSRPALQRQGAVFVLALLGLVAMAAQLTLLFAYQSHIGFMFERIALLNGLFMTGLAVGAGLGGRIARGGRPLGALVLVMSLVAAGMFALPQTLRLLGDEAPSLQEPGYLMLALIMGLLTGTGFPLGVELTHRDQPQILVSGGATVAADNLGGAAGGLITGALLVPLLGVQGACQVLALLALIALLPLLFARLAPESIPALRQRGFRSFPWPRMSWGLVFAVLLVYGWQLLAANAEPGPRVHFDQPRLEEVAGPARFELVEAPFVHYLGFSPGSSEPQTAALSTAAAAPGVKGFAGPINLLMALDRQGILRGVRYVESNETPSYIGGIDQWLAGLTGSDLGAGPLTLDRVDGLSGATVTCRAALEGITAAAGRVSKAAFGTSLPGLDVSATAGLDAAFWATLILLLAAVAAHLSGNERARLGIQLASIGVLGIWLNALVTEVDLVNLSLGHAAGPTENPQRWLLLGFTGLTTLLFGPIWCGYLCPFGALQELLSRIGRLLGLRTYPDRPLEQRMRYLKFILLALMLIVVWMSGDTLWASFDPMQHAFGARVLGWMLALVVAVLFASLIYVRFWCRYFCPIGALLALGNKLALGDRFAPRRRFEHCDLGVRDEFDLDCIRCGRCLTGSDTTVRHRPHRGRVPTPGATGG